MKDDPKFERGCIEIARAHLKYVMTDPSLGIRARRNSSSIVQDFYLNLFKDMEFEESISDLGELIKTFSEKNFHSDNSYNDYSFSKVLEAFGIEDNVGIFEALRSSGSSTYKYESNSSIKYRIDSDGVKKIASYLHKNGKINNKAMERGK